MNRHALTRSAGILSRPSAVLGALGLLVALAALPAVAEESALPSGDAILDKHIEAIGGVKALEALKNRVTKGRMDMPAMGMSGTVTNWQAPPNLSASHIEIGGMMTVDEGTDGELVWENNSMQGPRLKEGDEKAAALRRAMFPEHRIREQYKSIAVDGMETVGDRECYKLTMTPETGNPETWWIDRETHLLHKMATVEQGPMGEVPVTMTFGNYEKVDGIVVAHTSQMEMAGMEMSFTVDSIEHNVEIPAGTFEPPDEVQALLGE